MTADPQAAAAAPAAPAAPAPATAIHRGPTDLTLSFVDDATVRLTAAAAGDAEWLLADRLAGLAAFDALPIETNPLYTTYVDLRNARLDAVRPYGTAPSVAAAAAAAPLPEGAAAFAEFCENRVTALAMSPEARAGGLILETLETTRARDQWPRGLKNLRKGQARCFSHGFSVVFKDQTGVVPPKDVDVFLVAPKGAGRTVRTNFLAGSGINSSFAVYQDATGRAGERVVAFGMAIVSGYLFPTRFEKEVLSDLTGERGVLMGAIAGLMKAQYETLRAMGHSPSEAFNETVEEATQSLYPLIGANGMDWMFASCSTTAQRGALDWAKRFETSAKPLFELLYRDVRAGVESQRVLDTCSAPDYREKLEVELGAWRNSEMWRAGAAVRSLRPENWKKTT